MIDQVYEKRKCVRVYDADAKIEASMIEDLLRRTHKITPSKNNFMPYSIYVLGPEHVSYKESIYNKCLKNECRNDGVTVDEKLKRYKNPPNYAAILSCSYLLIFTLRLEDQPNPLQNYLMEKKGHYYEAVDSNRIHRLKDSASLEVGLFADAFTGLCAENDLDTSFTLCFPKKVEEWADIPMVQHRPLLLLTVGKGKIYRQDIAKEQGWAQYDLRPKFERIVTFVD